MQQPDNTKEIFEKAFDLVKQGVVAAADVLKTYAPQLWAMVRRQVILEGLECLACFLAFCVIMIWLIRVVRKGYSEREPDTNSGEPLSKLDIDIITGFIVGIWILASTAFLINATDLLLNPDYWTLMRVLEFRK